MYRLIKRLSIPLAICFLITSLPVQALTNNVQNQKSDNDIVTVPEKPEAKVRSEDTSKRDKFTKHYMKDDFTYDAVIYPVAVHYNDNGSWKDIDNSLVDSTDDSNNPVLENKENDVKFKYFFLMRHLWLITVVQ